MQVSLIPARANPLRNEVMTPLVPNKMPRYQTHLKISRRRTHAQSELRGKKHEDTDCRWGHSRSVHS